MEWQPIETAPKDGTEILGLHHYKGHEPDYSIVRWQHAKWGAYAWVAQADGQRAIESQTDFGTDYVEPFVTHWMNLPSPPKEKASA